MPITTARSGEIIPQSTDCTGMELLRIGCLRAAKIAPAALIRPARTLPGIEVRAVAARDHDRAEAFAAKHGVPVLPGLTADNPADAAAAAF